MKKYFSPINKFILHFLIYISCNFNMPIFCAFLIKLSLFKPKYFKKKIKSKKIFIVLYREIGIRDIEVIHNSAGSKFEFLFFKRSITKLILYCFCNRKKSFIDYLKNPVTIKDYFIQNSNNKKNHEDFWKNVVFNLKKYFDNKSINFITFNYTYFAEAALYAGCKSNNLPVKLWHKEAIQTDLDAEQEIKKIGYKFQHIFKYFTSISVYNELAKKKFIKLDSSNVKKISVNGCPRLKDYVIKKKFYKKPKTILFLSFDSQKGIIKNKQNKNLSWKISYNKIIKILNELSNNQLLNIIIKKKHNSIDTFNDRIDKRIKIFKSGSAERFINKADIIIGHNSSATIEGLASGKYVMVPFFENNLKLRKYLLNFDDDIIYTSEKKMKRTILNLLSKKVFFPLNSKKHSKTIRYYLGDSNNITKKYLNFLNKD